MTEYTLLHGGCGATLQPPFRSERATRSPETDSSPTLHALSFLKNQHLVHGSSPLPGPTLHSPPLRMSTHFFYFRYLSIRDISTVLVNTDAIIL